MPLMGNLFGRSPVRPMQQHMKVAVACARQVLPLFEDMAAGNTAELAAHRREIDRLEHEADDVLADVVDVTGDRAEHHRAAALHRTALEVRRQVGHRRVHRRHRDQRAHLYQRPRVFVHG